MKTTMQRGCLSRSVLFTFLGCLVVSSVHAQTNCTSAPLGLVGWWPAEGNSNDAMGSHNGTPHAGVSFTPGVVGQAFSFDGTTNAWIEVPDAPELRLTNELTIEFWVKRQRLTYPSFPYSDYIVEKGGDYTGGQDNYAAALHNASYNYCLHFTYAGGWRGAGSIADTNIWHHCAITARNGDTNPVFYIDGMVQPVTYAVGPPINLYPSTRPLHIGAQVDSNTGWFYYSQALVDELSIYDRVLSAAEIQAIYQAGSAGKCLVNNWTNPFSAKWESPSWSLGVLPAPDQSVNIMNDGYKAVNIDSATVAEFSSSLTVGSLNVGAPTNALSTLLLNYFGLGTPLKVLKSCTLLRNGTLLNLASSFEVDGNNGGTLTIDGGTFTQEEGLTVVNAPVLVRNGSINDTNGNLTLGNVILGTTDSMGSFNQDGGSIAAQEVSLQNGTFTLASGNLYAIGGTQLSPNGNFNQSGGNNYGDITMNGGHYNLSGGLVQGNVFSAHGGVTQQGALVMTGGVMDMHEMDWSDQGGWYLTTYLRHGTVRSGSINITGSANVYVEVADVYVTNNIDLRDTAWLETGFCHLTASTVTMYGTDTYNPTFWQGGGIIPAPTTNVLSSGLTMYGGQCILQGGTLQTPYIGVGANGRIAHEAGLNLVQGVLSITGQYEATGGDLVTDGLYLRGSMLLWGPPIGTFTFTNRGLLELGGNLGTGLTNAWGGQVRISTNGIINFIGSPAHAQLRFAASSDVPWTPGALLVINNWTNSGATRIFFGNDAFALTTSQLAQIQFANPGGFQPGNYPAQLLSTGELVPAQRPTLQMSRSGSALVFTWSGNYQLLSATNVTGPYNPVSSASSPWTNYFTKPREFFLLQGF